MVYDIVYSPLCLHESVFLDGMSEVSLLNRKRTNTFLFTL